jgi:hypothetical protein
MGTLNHNLEHRHFGRLLPEPPQNQVPKLRGIIDEIFTVDGMVNGPI